MSANVYTKTEILEHLAQSGHIVDAYTLDTFFKKWKIEAIFEDEQGIEFFDANTLEFVLNNLFNNQQDEDNVMPDESKEQEQNTRVNENEFYSGEQTEVDALELLKNITLSDGASLIDKIEDIPSDIDKRKEMLIPPMDETPRDDEYQPQLSIQEYSFNNEEKTESAPVDSQAEQSSEPLSENNNQEEQQENNDEFDDMTLLSESLEAQEKFKEYVIQEFSRKNGELVLEDGDAKAEITDKTLNMIAKAMAKKIAKYVGAICYSEAKAEAKLEELQIKNKKLKQKVCALEDQNKKLRLLLTESNKNLNSYKRSLFGLYKKIK